MGKRAIGEASQVSVETERTLICFYGQNGQRFSEDLQIIRASG